MHICRPSGVQDFGKIGLGGAQCSLWVRGGVWGEICSVGFGEELG